MRSKDATSARYKQMLQYIPINIKVGRKVPYAKILEEDECITKVVVSGVGTRVTYDFVPN